MGIYSLRFLAAPASVLILAGCSQAPTQESPATARKSYTVDTMTVAKASAQMEKGTLSSLDLVERSLASIEAIDTHGPKLQSVLSINPDAKSIARALDMARKEGQARGPFHGIPVLIKDNIETLDNLPTTAGSLALLENKNDRDAPIIAKLRASGAVILGKANLSQWANFRSEGSVSGWSAVRGQVRNPHALNRSPCGSSSGSGAAVAAGIVMAAIGTETNGSIICPASMNGIVGFKPTVGVLSQQYIVPISSTQDTAGPMTRTVMDAALMMDAMTENNGAYAATLGAAKAQNIRIGVLNFAQGDNAGVKANFEAALDTLKEQGFTLVEIEEWEPPEGFGKASYDVLKYEFKATLNDYLASTNPKVKTRTLAELIAFNEENAVRELAVFDQSIFEVSEALGDLKTKEYTDGLAMVLKATRADGIDKLLADNKVDILLAPSTAPTFLIDHVYGDSYPGGTGAGWIAAIAGYPHITVPMGAVKGLPIGLSFMGKAGDDKQVMAAGYIYEQASQKRVTPTFMPSLEMRTDGEMLRAK